MQTFNQSLVKLTQDGTIEWDEALACSTNPNDLKLMLKGIGRRRHLGAPRARRDVRNRHAAMPRRHPQPDRPFAGDSGAQSAA
jgi:hypothetical protein